MDSYYRTVTLILAGILGLCVGSFLNVVIYRVPRKMSLAKPASHCPGCGNPIRWYDNIPVISYLLLGGKCRSCKMHISFRYTAVEIANTVLWLLCVWRFGAVSIPCTLCAMGCTSLLLCVFFTDLENMLIPDRFQILLGILGLAVTVFDPETAWYHHLIGGVAGFAVPALIAWVFRKVTGKDGLGGGDVKLCAVMGLYLGWQKLLLGVTVGSLAGCLVLIPLQNREKEYPFAPFLTAGFAIALFLGEWLIRWYVGLIL